MAKKSREKGRKAELEVATLIYDRLGIALERRLTQYRKSGEADLDGWDGVSIEVKRHARATQADVASWWEEARSQCKNGEIPVLAYRADYQAWRFVICPDDWSDVPVSNPVEIDIEGLVSWQLIKTRG